jgi:AraC-like DNA-binding protein
MHKSISMYANALRCTPGHVRRYIRQGKIPSAQLIPSRFGRPSWSITDCSPEAIADLKVRVQGQPKLPSPVTFHEPVPVFRVGKNQNGKTVLGVEIIWEPAWRPLRAKDAIGAGHDVITRFTMLGEGLSWDDLRRPPTTIVGGLRRVEASHQEKIKAFEQKRLKYLRKWVSPSSPEDQQFIQKLLADINLANIREAAEYLALYHRRYDVPITYKTLARVLGISKSSLYRQYRRKLIQSALRGARSAATSPTQGTIRKRDELE